MLKHTLYCILEKAELNTEPLTLMNSALGILGFIIPYSGFSAMMGCQYVYRWSGNCVENRLFRYAVAATAIET